MWVAPARADLMPQARAGALALLLLAGLQVDSAADEPAQQQAARHFLAQLDDKERSMAALSWLSPYRTQWSYLPWGHTGLALSDLDDPQKAAALGLLAAGLSETGRRKAMDVIALEADEAHRGLLSRLWEDPEAYHTVVFGVPGPANLWSWRFEGHHLSINLSHANGEIVSGTPYFIGADPARVDDGPLAGLAILEQEEQMARALYLSLDDNQRGIALIKDTAPADIFTGSDSRATLACCEGLSADAMHPGQREELLALVDLILDQLEPVTADIHRQRMLDAGIRNLRFAWAGAEQPGKAHYYRIQGPTILIEYDNSEDDANHVHLVLRDPELDFGGDPLHARKP